MASAQVVRSTGASGLGMICTNPAMRIIVHHHVTGKYEAARKSGVVPAVQFCLISEKVIAAKQHLAECDVCRNDKRLLEKRMAFPNSDA